MAFSCDLLHDTSTFTLHITISVDPNTNQWQCTATCGAGDVSADVGNINIPDGTYLPIHSSFSCIRDKVYNKVHDKIVSGANFPQIMQNFLTKYLGEIPTSVTIYDSLKFNFAPTLLSFADTTGGLAVGFNGTLSFSNAPATDPVSIPLPTPDPAHTAVIRVATCELGLIFAGLFLGKQLQRRFDAASVPQPDFFNTSKYQSEAPPFYNWAPGAQIVLYLSASLPPSVINIQPIWVVTEQTLSMAGITPSSDADAYNRLEPLVKQHSIFTSVSELNSRLQYLLTPDQYAKYDTTLVSGSATTALPVADVAAARVCVVDPSGAEKEAFVIARTSTFLSSVYAVGAAVSQPNQHVLTFDFAETGTSNTLSNTAVPNLTADQASIVVDMLMMVVDKYVQDVGKQGIPIPTIAGFTIKAASANFIASPNPKPGPCPDAIIEVAADLAVSTSSH